MTTSIDESLLTEIAARRARRSRSFVGVDAEDLRLILSESDVDSYVKLETIFYARGGRWGNEAYKIKVTKAFDSPCYSDASKEYFAAANVGDESILASCGQFLTEKIILSYITHINFESFSSSYFAALLGSEHMSERIILAIIEGVGNLSDFRAYKILELIPAWLITPEIVTNWLYKLLLPPHVQSKSATRALAALRVKQTYPEYEGFPDDWVLKVFCGG